MRWTEQQVPKPDRFQGSDDEAYMLTGQDNRLGYPTWQWTQVTAPVGGEGEPS